MRLEEWSVFDGIRFPIKRANYHSGAKRAYPDSVIGFDEAKGQIVDRIPLTTGLPTSLRLSLDRKKIYVTTNDHSGLEVIDVATRKVINHFVLNTATKRYRFTGGTPDRTDKLFYTVTTEIEKQVDPTANTFIDSAPK
jgi:hypothetical protein